MTCRPNHPARHEPFEENNKLSLRHGAYSPTVIAEEASRVHSALLVECPWLDEPRYMPSLMRYLTASAREQLAHKALTSAAKFSPRLLEAATAAARLAWMMGDELGLTPAGHAKLKVLLADAIGAEVSVAQLVETGRQIVVGAAFRNGIAEARILPGERRNRRRRGDASFARPRRRGG